MADAVHILCPVTDAVHAWCLVADAVHVPCLVANMYLRCLLPIHRLGSVPKWSPVCGGSDPEIGEQTDGVEESDSPLYPLRPVLLSQG